MVAVDIIEATTSETKERIFISQMIASVANIIPPRCALNIALIADAEPAPQNIRTFSGFSPNNWDKLEPIVAPNTIVGSSRSDPSPVDIDIAANDLDFIEFRQSILPSLYTNSFITVWIP